MMCVNRYKGGSVIWRPELFQNSKIAMLSTLHLSDRGAFINRYYCTRLSCQTLTFCKEYGK